jgi:hypothetical protein
MKDEVGDGKAEPFRTVLRQSRSINPATPPLSLADADLPDNAINRPPAFAFLVLR